MEVIQTAFEDLYIIQHKVFNDERGQFVKTYNQELFKQLNIDVEIKERYYSVSHKNVIRGMHFQTPPAEHVKLVNVISGAILDVVLDLRNDSKTYGHFFSIELLATDPKTIYIPVGFAHGFKSLAQNTIVEYNQTSCYSSVYDSGIRFDSFGFDWKVDNVIISDRDRSFCLFNDFKSPF